jgi:tetratricopeptide (TPR) repeat protein
LRYCLLYPDGEGYRLHELLKADARDNDRWLQEGEDPATHRDLYRFYQKRFSQRPSGDAEALVEECEAFHHAMHSGDRELMHAARPYFAAQLDLLGRTLSRDHKEYRTAAEVFERAYVWEPDDAYAHHYRAYNLDVLAESPELVERHYQRAIQLEPDNVWWRSRWISYLITRGRMAASHSAWLDTLDQVELPDAGADPTIYRNLHVWVARLLLHRGQLDMAAEVLEGIPEENLRDDLGLRALKRRLDALLQARRGEAVFPLSVSQDHQWDGPHLAPKRLNKHPLTRWMPARVDAVSEEGISLQVAEPPREPSNSARIGFLEVSRDQFNRGSEDIDAEQLEAGRFLELVWYEQQEQPLIRVFPAHEAQDPDLPPLFPDPARYLRRAGWVE